MTIVGDAFAWVFAHPSILAVAFLIYVFIFVLSVLFSGPKPGKNPFLNDCSRPPKPLVLDQAVRDKVLKQAFHTKRIPDQLDAIVIGSGIGGLGAAAILAKAGKRVLVLEQHDQAGGCCHSFIEKGYEFDVGIHYIGEMRDNTLARLLCSQVTEGQLQWQDLIDEFDVVAIGEPGKQKYYPFNAGGKEAWKATMLKSFPQEEKALDGFLKLLTDFRKEMVGQFALKFISKFYARILINTGLIYRFTKYFQYATRTMEEVIGELTDNKDLRAVLSYSFGDFGCIPSKAPFSMHAALINHLIQGGSYPRGGASEIAFHIIPVIERPGGKVLVRAKVSQVLTDSRGKAVGVRVQKTSGDVDVFAPLVISDAGAVNTFKSLLPPEIAQKSSINRLIQEKKVDSGVGALSVFIGMKGTTEELGLKAQNVWAFTGNNLSQITEDFLSQSAEAAAESEVPLCFISFASARDSTYQQRFPGKSVCTVITLARWEWFSQWENERVNKRGQDYEAIKNGIGRHMWEQVLAIYPQLEDKVEYFEVGSPLSNKYYIASPKGEIYGLDHDMTRFGSPEVIMTLRPETDIPGLLLTGQDVASCGFIGAFFGGLLCASKALNRNVMYDLINLKKTVDKTK